MKTRKAKKGLKKTRRGGGFLLKTDKSNLQELMDIISSMMDDFNKTFRKKKHYQNLLNKIKDDKEELIKLKLLLSDEIDEKFEECIGKPSQYHAHRAECFDEYYEIVEKFNNVSSILHNIEKDEKIKENMTLELQELAKDEIEQIKNNFEKSKKTINEWINKGINDSGKLNLLKRLKNDSDVLETYLKMSGLENSDFKKKGS